MPRSLPSIGSRLGRDLLIEIGGAPKRPGLDYPRRVVS